MIKEIGNHRVKHGDVMQLSVPNGLMSNDKCHIFYSDPPWGSGNLKYWQTMNEKMNTNARAGEVDYEAFLNQIFNLASSYTTDDGIIFIEYGIKWKQDLLKRAQVYGLYHLGTAEPIYRSGSKFLPLHLHIFSKSPMRLPSGYLESIKDTYGMDTLRQAVRPFIRENGIVFDPCCGMGYSAQISIENKMFFRGNELNETRLNKTIKRLKPRT